MLIDRCRQLHAENMEMNKAAEALSSRLQVNAASTLYCWCTFKERLGPDSAGRNTASTLYSWCTFKERLGPGSAGRNTASTLYYWCTFKERLGPDSSDRNTASTLYYWCTFKERLGPGSADSCHTFTLTSCQNSVLHSHRSEGEVSLSLIHISEPTRPP